MYLTRLLPYNVTGRSYSVVMKSLDRHTRPLGMFHSANTLQNLIKLLDVPAPLSVQTSLKEVRNASLV